MIHEPGMCSNESTTWSMNPACVVLVQLHDPWARNVWYWVHYRIHESSWCAIGSTLWSTNPVCVRYFVYYMIHKPGMCVMGPLHGPRAKYVCSWAKLLQDLLPHMYVIGPTTRFTNTVSVEFCYSIRFFFNFPTDTLRSSETPIFCKMTFCFLPQSHY